MQPLLVALSLASTLIAAPYLPVAARIAHVLSISLSCPLILFHYHLARLVARATRPKSSVVVAYASSLACALKPTEAWTVLRLGLCGVRSRALVDTIAKIDSGNVEERDLDLIYAACMVTKQRGYLMLAEVVFKNKFGAPPVPDNAGLMVSCMHFRFDGRWVD